MTTENQTTETQTTAIAVPEGMRIHHATMKAAEKLVAMLAAEYPALTLTVSESADTGKAIWTVHAYQDGDEEMTFTYDKVPALADLLEECEENGIDPEASPDAEEDEEPKASGSVVPDHYRETYRMVSSNGQNCGDWLAEWLTTQTHGQTGFMVDDFTQLLSLNGVDLNTKWGQLPTSGQKGWVGRYRMNGRQVMEKAVAKSGVAIDLLGHPNAAPEDFLIALRTKHGKWLAKEAKREAAADAAVKEAVEGPTIDEATLAADTKLAQMEEVAARLAREVFETHA